MTCSVLLPLSRWICRQASRRHNVRAPWALCAPTSTVRGAAPWTESTYHQCEAQAPATLAADTASCRCCYTYQRHWDTDRVWLWQEPHVYCVPRHWKNSVCQSFRLASREPKTSPPRPTRRKPRAMRHTSILPVHYHALASPFIRCQTGRNLLKFLKSHWHPNYAIASQFSTARESFHCVTSVAVWTHA